MGALNFSPQKAKLKVTGCLFLFLILFSASACDKPAYGTIDGSAGSKLLPESFGTFHEPWAMTFLPDGNLLITEKSGTLVLFRMDDRSKIPIEGVPKVAYGGQGGLGDVILHPHYKENNLIYLSYAEEDTSGNRGAAVARARFLPTSSNPKLENFEVIWRQQPKVSGKGHYAHRLAFSPDGKLFITSGDRQKQKPAQSWTQNLGKVIRINADGSVPPDNPFQDTGELAKTFWTLGHRNLLGIAFDKQGQLWTHEMGPRHGDEFNLIIAGDNYGWPLVSWGDQYSGFSIPDHDTRPEFHAPEVYWVPTVAPSGLIIYSGSLFPQWRGNAFLGGLRSKSLVRIKIEGDQAKEVERFDMGERIREVEQGPDGAIWVLEDGKGGRLLRLSPGSK
ncbi:Glucose/arabinose dehydrogenase, beta-propeller fold [Candidatus Electrothrix aarhusensis]|uniref:Glucose/arabinose dehydrogenase, beta-propeller fold n=1 Tax=Candidatus Electrothrix aarhusensis TaxID=1859131 RepID=A0A3S3QPQ4_9BACT|nr:Glucose/arabinose dehydrogenase, beta-propeller fold [Candidatus Electrothrix aarhusensis]